MTWFWLGPLWLTVAWWFFHTGCHVRFRDTGTHLHISWQRPTLIGFLRWYTGRQLYGPDKIAALEKECGLAYNGWGREIDPSVDPAYIAPHKYDPDDPQSPGWTIQRYRADEARTGGFIRTDWPAPKRPKQIPEPKAKQPLKPAVADIWAHEMAQLDYDAFAIKTGLPATQKEGE